MENIDQINDIMGKLKDELAKIRKESVGEAFQCIVDEAVKNMKKDDRSESLAKMALEALANASFSLPDEIVPKDVKFNIIYLLDILAQQTQVDWTGWQGIRNMKCGDVPGGRGCVIPEEGSTCLQKKKDNKWYCISGMEHW